MVKQYHDTPPRPIRPEGTRFVKDGLDSKGIGVGGVKKSSNVSTDLHIQPTIPWLNTPKEQQYFNKACELQRKVDKFPWYELGCGFAIGSLLWGIMFTLFGGN